MVKFADLCTHLYSAYCNQFYAEPDNTTISSKAIEHAFRLGFVSGFESVSQTLTNLGPQETAAAIINLRGDTQIRCKELESEINEILSPKDKGRLN